MSRLLRFAFAALLLIGAVRPAFAAEGSTAAPRTFSWSSLPSALTIDPPPPPPPVSPRSGFEGVLAAGPGSGVHIASGENTLMIAGHGTIAIVGLGGSNRSEVSARDFFGFVNGTITDTQCFYDPVSRVWWVMGMWSPPGDLPRTLVIAHSTSPNPRTTWGLTTWETATIVSRRVTEYGAEPIAAMAPGRFVVVLRHFVVATGRQDYESVLVFDRFVFDNNYGYAPPVELRITAPPAGGDRWDMTSTRPAVCLDRTANEVLLVTSRADGGSRVTLRRIVGPPSAPVLLPGEFVNVAPYSTAPGARQRGTMRPLRTGDCRVRSAIVRDGVLSAAWHEAGRSGGSTASGIRVLQVRLRDRAVLTDQSLGDARTFAWAPALTPDAYGSLHLAFVRSATDEFPSVWTTVRRPGASRFGELQLVRAGEATSDSLDWSGPSAIALDPSPLMPGQTAWAAASYARGAGARGIWAQPVIAPYGLIAGAVVTDCGGDAPSPDDRRPAAGRTVTLRLAGTPIATALTSEAGTFAFDGLESGTYDVIASIPTGGAAVEAIAGQGGTRADATGANSVRITLTSSQSSAGTTFVLADPRPMPRIASLSPAFRYAGSAACTLVVTGSGFVPCSAVRVGTSTHDARYVSPTELRATLSATDLATAGARAIRVSSPAPGGGLSESAAFEVRTPDVSPPTVTLLAPVGGENWPMRNTRRIAWTATDDRGIASVSLAYSTDDGATFTHTIAAAIPDSGHFDWTLPDTGAAALRVRVTVRDEFGNVAADSSRAAFALPVWTIRATATGPGTITPSGDLPVLDGTAVEFALVANEDSYLSRLLVNGVAVTPTPSYTFPPVHANQTITAEFGARVYAWNVEAVAGDFNTPGNWSPARLTPMVDDVLLFQIGGLTSATNVPTQRVGQIRVLHGTLLTLQASTGATLTLGGGDGHDLWIEAGSQLALGGSSGTVTVALATGTTGRVEGAVSFGAGNQRLVAKDESALRFGSGARCTIGATAAGGAFGTGTGTSGFGSVVFDSSAVLDVLGFGDPFGATAPNSVLKLEHGSRYVHRARGSALDLTGRTLGDFDFESGMSASLAGALPVTLDSLIVGAGALLINCSATLTVRGDVTVKPGARLTIGTGDFANPVRLGGSAPQRITRLGAFSTTTTAALTIDNPSGVTLGSDLAWSGSITFAHGVLHLGSATLDLGATSAIAGAAETTGWIDGRVRRTIPSGASTQVFPVGTASAYAPLQLDFTLASPTFALAVSCGDGKAPGLSSAPVDTAYALNRHWTLTSPTSPASLDFTARMTYVPADLPVGTLASELSPFQFAGFWYPRSGGASGANRIVATHCTTFGVLTAAKSSYGDYAVAVTVDGPGFVERSPDQSAYAYGDIVTLTAQPVPPATFVGWSGDTTSAQSPLSISVTRERHLTATFREPVSYVWKNSVSSGLWTDSLNWTPTRGTPTPNDILVFSGSGAVTARGLRSETIAQLLVSGTMQVAFESDSAATITLRGEGGPALSIAAGSRLSLTNTSPLTLALQRYAAGVIDGRLTLTGAAHRLVARDTAAVTFSAGSLCEIGTGESGGAFGDGTGTSGGRCVYFAAGSRLEQSAGGDPFGAPWYSAAIAFLPGSRYVVRGPGVTIALGGRTFADFEYDVPGGQTIVTLDAPVTMDSLVVRTGSLHITQSATLVLRGDLTLHPGGVLGLSAIYGGAPILLRGTATQRITTLGQIYWSASPTLEIDNPAGVVLGSPVRWLGPLRFWHGLLHTGPHTFDLGGTFGTLGAGESTGWVVGNLRRRVYNLSTPYVFATGDSTRYAPMTLIFGSGPGDFEVTASTTAGRHPLLGSTPVDTSRSLRRWWSLSSPTATPANLSYEAILSFAPGDLDSSVTPGQLAPMLYNAGWYYPTAGISSGTTVRANGLTLYGDLTAGLPLAGPVEPRYRWTAASPRASFTDPGSWTPPRLLRRVDDILEFSRGTVDTAYGVPIQSIGQLVVSNGTTATLSSTVNATLDFTGRAGDDLVIATGSTLRLTGTNAINSVQLVLADTATARISGTLELKDALHHLLGSAPDAIVFADSGACVLSGTFDGNPFGSGAPPSSLGSVRFARGSTLRQSAGGDPFGTQFTDAVLTFDPGSRYRIESNAFTPAFSRRAFADVEVAVPSGIVDVTTSQTFTMDSLIVRQGTFNLTPSGGCDVRGDILVYRLATLNIAPRFGPSSIRIHGSTPQRLVGTGTFASGPYPNLVLDNPAGLVLATNVTWRGAVSFVHGQVRTGAFAFTVDTASVVTASQATGWVNGTLKRSMRFGAPTAAFAVGTDSVYAPVTVSLTGNTLEFPLAVSTTDGDHPDLTNSGGDPARSVNRWWTLVPVGASSFAAGAATFTFATADLDTATTSDVLVPFQRTSGWTPLTIGARTATSVRAAGFTTFGAFALAEPLPAGAPGVVTHSPADDAPVVAFALGAPSPNPSRGSARIPFALPREARVRVSVLDVQGREVAALADGAFAAGRHGVAFDAAGRPLAAGLYFVRMRVSGGPEFTRRIVIAR